MYRPALFQNQISREIVVSGIFTIHYLELDKNFSYEGESHTPWEFVYIDKGCAFVTAGEKEWLLRQGEYVFHKPEEYHNLRCDRKTAPNVFVVAFGSDSPAMQAFEGLSGRLPESCRGLVNRILEEARQAFVLPFMDIFMKGMKKRENALVGSEQLVALYLEQLLLFLLREINKESLEGRHSLEQERKSNDMVRQILQLMEEQLYGELHIDDICRKLNYGKTSLCTKFKAYTGYTINEYFHRLKMETAKRLIRERKYDLSEIAGILHYDSPQYFSRVFKRLMQMTPTEYSRSIRAYRQDENE